MWPFAHWGIDIVGPLPTVPGNYTHAVVAVEYFSMWVEAKPLLSITSATIQKFFWQNIVCRFGVPYEVTVDNGKQFDSTDFKEFCTYLGTKLCFASVYHPQSNGAVERANGIIFASIKRNITELPKSKWAEELPRVIWSHNTQLPEPCSFHLSSCFIVTKPCYPRSCAWEPGGTPLPATKPSRLQSRTSRKHAYRPELTCYLTRKKLEDGKTRRFDRSSHGGETRYYARSRREN
jgi:transposase InsO family protein